MKRTAICSSLRPLRGSALAGVGAAAQNEQFVPVNFYRVGPYAPGGSGFGGGIIDYLNLINERDGGINGVKLTWEECETEYNIARGVECYERLKKQGPDRRDRDPSAVDRHRLRADRAGDRRQDPDDLRSATAAPIGRRRPRVPVRLPADHHLLVAGHGDGQVSSARRWAAWTSSRARRSCSSTTTRPTARSRSRCSTRLAKKYGFELHADRGAAPGQRAAVAVAADPPDQARLRDPLGLGRDEPDRAQDRRQDRLPARQDHRRLVGRLRGRRDAGGRRGQGLHRGAASTRRAPTSR